MLSFPGLKMMTAIDARRVDDKGNDGRVDDKGDVSGAAREFNTRLSDDRQFGFGYKFYIVDVCESDILENFRLSGYGPFRSVCPHGPSRSKVSIRAELTYVVHPIPPH